MHSSLRTMMFLWMTSVLMTMIVKLLQLLLKTLRKFHWSKLNQISKRNLVLSTISWAILSLKNLGPILINLTRKIQSKLPLKLRSTPFLQKDSKNTKSLKLKSKIQTCNEKVLIFQPKLKFNLDYNISCNKLEKINH